MDSNEKYLSRCIEIAANGLGKVSPNPMVGCVIVCNGDIIGEGYHARYGESHAEVNAINSVKDKALLKQSTLFVNLEPCNHHGKTPPCTDPIIRYEIPKVLVGSVDTHSKVSGRGIEFLKQNGVEVVAGVLENECRKLNKRFFTFHEKHRPYIILKWANSADGYFDLDRSQQVDAKPNFISNEYSRVLVHKWRTEEDSILIGTNTAVIDNPLLTSRDFFGKNPLRVILDRKLRIPSNFNIYNNEANTLIYNESKTENVNNVCFEAIDFGEDMILDILRSLYRRKIQSVIVEGGATILNLFIEKNMWDEARVITGNTNLKKGIKAPVINKEIVKQEIIKEDIIRIYSNNTSNNSN